MAPGWIQFHLPAFGQDMTVSHEESQERHKLMFYGYQNRLHIRLLDHQLWGSSFTARAATLLFVRVLLHLWHKLLCTPTLKLYPKSREKNQVLSWMTATLSSLSLLGYLVRYRMLQKCYCVNCTVVLVVKKKMPSASRACKTTSTKDPICQPGPPLTVAAPSENADCHCCTSQQACKHNVTGV